MSKTKDLAIDEMNKKRERPKHSDCKTNMDYLRKVEEYCSYLEKERERLIGEVIKLEEEELGCS